MNSKDKLDAARLLVYRRHPYVASVLLSLRPIEKIGIGTLGVSAGWHLYYDPETVQQWPTEHLASVCFHEVLHVLHDHATRKQNREPWAWNIAGDAEINPCILEAGWTLPGDPVIPTVRNLLAEEYYKPGKDACSCCGGCAGNPFPWEDAESAPGVSPVVQDTLRRQTAEAIRDAGDAPASLKRWAAAHLAPPKVDWRKQFARLVRNAAADAMGATDFTWRRPSRRGAGARPCIVPALQTPKLDVGVILDASGSMEGGPAAAARSEVFGVVKTVGPCTVYVADTRIASRKRVAQVRDIADLGETLGGTDMRAACLEVQKMKKHSVLVLLTDGFTGWPEPGEMHVPLVVAVTPGGDSPPAYIRSVRCEK